MQKHFQNLPLNALKQLLPLTIQNVDEEQPLTTFHPILLQFIFMWHNPFFCLSQ